VDSTEDPVEHLTGALSRRAIIGASALGLLGVATACSARAAPADVVPSPREGTDPRPPGPTTAAPTTTTVAPLAPTSGPLTLLTPTELNFNALLALGGTAHQTAEIGEMVATIERVNAAGVSYQTYVDEFMARGDQLAAEAKMAEDGGHLVTARSRHRRAAQYYNQGLFFVLGTEDPAREPEIYSQVQTHWEAVARLEAPPFERVEIPYEGRSLRGYFLAARGVTGPRPTVIVQNGSDAQHIDVWTFGGAAAIERGYHALFFEGPGQGGELFVNDVPFRPDWEAVITPVVDYLAGRPDVDAAKIALTGWSFSGTLVVRAAARERRVAAVVSDPGGVAPWLAFPDFLRAYFDNGATQEQVNRAWAGIVPAIPADQQFGIRKRAEIFGGEFLAAARRGEMFTDFWTLGQTLMTYDISGFAPEVRCPVLVTGYEGETFLPGQDQQLFDLLRSPKEHHMFTAADGAELHDAPVAPQRRNEVVFDWLDDVLR
jgi:dienelactone hydrolase